MAGAGVEYRSLTMSQGTGPPPRYPYLLRNYEKKNNNNILIFMWDYTISILLKFLQFSRIMNHSTFLFHLTFIPRGWKKENSVQYYNSRLIEEQRHTNLVGMMMMCLLCKMKNFQLSCRKDVCTLEPFSTFETLHPKQCKNILVSFAFNISLD